ncbi:hypothetical protein E3P81_03065 [Wallemia ichthyophaga]|nr:hypothetical protein E3P97_03152 [Wallemia ichthyophaga]TIB28211.1 hypothetical protein E3P85_03791 [Wallemia ichthyophaga]TIB45083.1 hypothetical protein E3P82_03125 [Wallemia ichthyophaga]TIB48092.1 hypothetical protein E3P81_03065 [Wallemia ichthyophaga]TIB51198.1 hypothetical protein E3P80_03130 [Wallemia ichthyophaga]
MDHHDQHPPNTQDTFKILLCTDLHIGVHERDPVRGADSINTLREILDLSVQNDVDFILCAGDLFHEHKPSTQSVISVMSLLREYCLNDRPVSIQLLSDPYDQRRPDITYPSINYEDSNLNVGLPFFLIHGNHDDPQTVPNWPSGAPSLSAVDHLSTAGLVNYFGKVDVPATDEAPDDGLDDERAINVKPILLQKGTTKTALFGIGNIRDQRFNQELKNGRVNMYAPLEDADDYFNILLIHQNRINRGAMQAVPEHLFDDSISLVVWGHEHDCRIVPETVSEKPYRITQPGSSVATSLSEGEAVPKHVGLLEIHGKEYNLTPLPLKTVRPFVMQDVCLREVQEERGVQLAGKLEVNKYLRHTITELIERAYEEHAEKMSISLHNLDRDSLPLPLIRLRVDYTGFEIGNPQRLGMEFGERVANPKDIVHFTRKRQQRKAAVVADEPGQLDLDVHGGENENEDDEDDGSRSGKLKLRVESLVNSFLAAQHLQLLHEDGLQRSVEAFVEKGDNHAIADSVERMVEHAVEFLSRQSIADVEDDDDIEKAKAYTRDKYRGAHTRDETDEAGERGLTHATADSMHEDGGDSEVDVAPAPAPTRGRGRGRSRGAARGKSTATSTGRGRGRSNVTSKDTHMRKKRGEEVEEEDEHDEHDEALFHSSDDSVQLTQPSRSKKSSARAEVLSRGTSNSTATGQSISHVPQRRRRTQEFYDVSSEEEDRSTNRRRY